MVHSHRLHHSAREYVSGAAHTNGIESFWAQVKWAYRGTYIKWSPNHLDRYLTEFTGRLGLRDLGRPDQVQLIFNRRVTKRTPSRYRTRVITMLRSRAGRQPDARPKQKGE